MDKIVILLMALLAVSIVYGLTLTADTTESVSVPRAALGTICLVDPSTQECSDKRGEIIFGNARVVSRTGDEIGLVLIQFGGQLYRAASFGPVYEYAVIMNDGTTLTATSRTIPEEGVESVEVTRILGLQGTLSQVLPDGNEISTTGEVRIIEEESKVSSEEPIPVGTFYIEYEGLVLENSDECGPYSYLDEKGDPVKGISTRECVSRRAMMTAGEYTALEFIINAPEGISDLYRLTDIMATTSFEWTPE